MRPGWRSRDPVGEGKPPPRLRRGAPRRRPFRPSGCRALKSAHPPRVRVPPRRRHRRATRLQLRRREAGWRAAEGERPDRRITNSRRRRRPGSQRQRGEPQTYGPGVFHVLCQRHLTYPASPRISAHGRRLHHVYRVARGDHDGYRQALFALPYVYRPSKRSEGWTLETDGETAFSELDDHGGTPDSGYLTRHLVDVGLDTIITAKASPARRASPVAVPVNGRIAHAPTMQYAGFMDTVSFRLPSDVIDSLALAASRRGVARSVVVREALVAFLDPVAEEDTTGALIDALVTYPGSGVGDLAARSEEHLRARFHGRRRSG